jgi:hypothetical protein
LSPFSFRCPDQQFAPGFQKLGALDLADPTEEYVPKKRASYDTYQFSIAGNYMVNVELFSENNLWRAHLFSYPEIARQKA